MLTAARLLFRLRGAVTGAAAAVVCLAAPAARADGEIVASGPPLGNVRYTAVIQDGPDGADTDDYSGELAAGERLSLRVKAPFRSPLFPLVQVVGPDGASRDVQFLFRKLGRDIELRSWPVDSTGRWTVRVGQRLGTTGEYTAKFSVRSPGATRITVPPDATGSTPADVTLPIEALEGSRVEIRLRGKRGTMPAVTSLRDVGGADVVDELGGLAVAGAVTKRGSVTLVVPSIAAGSGSYEARLFAPAGHNGFTAQARVVPPKRATGKRRLSAEEPWFESRATAARGVHGRTLRIFGSGFSTTGEVKVLFGGVEGTTLSVESHGVWVDVDPPLLPGDRTYPVEIVNDDSQSYLRPAYFYYVPEPVLEAAVDRDGAPVIGASTEGGRVVRILGSGFQTGIFLRFGQSADVLPRIVSATEIEVTTPAHVEGVVDVRIFDAYLHDGTLPGTFEFKIPPVVGNPPYSPTTASTDGTTVLTVIGSSFQPTDEVLFDGSPLTTTYLGSQFLRVTIPAAAAGTHRIAVRDRVGTIAAAPDITLVAP